MALCGVHGESFEVGESVVVGVVEHRCPYLVLIPLLYAKHVVLIMVVGIKVRDVKIAIGQYHQYLVFVVELTHEASMLIVVDAVNIGVKPHLASSQGAVAMAFQADTVDGTLGQDNALGASVLDIDGAEVTIHKDTLALFQRSEERRVGKECRSR